jgi:hypothetical protein
MSAPRHEARSASLFQAVDYFMARAPLLPLANYPLAGGPRADPDEAPVALDDRALRAVAVSSLSLAAAVARPPVRPRDRERRVSKLVADEAVHAAELLLRLTPFPEGLPSIAAYRQAFEGRYGADRDVPLLELLDPAAGLGLPPDAPGACPLRVGG